MTRWHPRGFGGRRTDPEDIKRESWQSLGILVIDVADERLTWPERELIQQLGSRLFPRHKRGLQ